MSDREALPDRSGCAVHGRADCDDCSFKFTTEKVHPDDPILELARLRAEVAELREALTSTRQRIKDAYYGGFDSVRRDITRKAIDEIDAVLQGAADEERRPALSVECTVCAGTGAQLCECDKGERPIANCFSCSGRECVACGGAGEFRDTEQTK